MLSVRLAVIIACLVLGALGNDDVSDIQVKIDYEVIPTVGTYFFIEVATNWTDAFQQCRDQGGYMATITTPEEYNSLLPLLTKYNVNSVHLGFHDKFTEGTYVTIDNVKIASDTAFWVGGAAPADNPAKNCGSFTTVGIVDSDCLLEQATICELRQSTSYTPLSETSSYHYHPEKRTWAAAWDTCHGEGGHLVIIDSMDEVNALSAKYHFLDIWTGVHRVHGDTLFYSVFNDALEYSGYTHWAPNYPFGTSVSHPYLALSHSVSAVSYPLFVTHTPTGQLPFICEI